MAAPSLRVAPRWGDWHLAEALAAALTRAGAQVRCQTLDRAERPAGRASDVHIVLRGQAPVRRTPGQAHVLWVISHPESIDLEECDRADLVLVASERFASDLARRTSTPVAPLLQATDPERFSPRPPQAEHSHPLAVVGSTRHEFRPCVRLALDAGLRPAIYGNGWRGLVDPAMVVADHVPNDRLAEVYSSVGVLLADHWDTMREWGFVSNRTFDAVATGAILVSDHMPEIPALLGPAVATYRDSSELASAVEEAWADRDAAAERVAIGRRTVLSAHTFDHRAAEVLALLARHGLGRPDLHGPDLHGPDLSPSDLSPPALDETDLARHPAPGSAG